MGKRQKASTSQHASAPHAPPSLSQLADVVGQLSSARREPRAAATAAKDRMGSLEEEEEGLDDSSSVVPTSKSKSSGTCTHTHAHTHTQTHTHTLAFSGSEEEDGSESEDSEVQAEEAKEAKGKKGKGSKPVEMVPATQYDHNESDDIGADQIMYVQLHAGGPSRLYFAVCRAFSWVLVERTCTCTRTKHAHTYAFCGSWVHLLFLLCASGCLCRKAIKLEAERAKKRKNGIAKCLWFKPSVMKFLELAAVAHGKANGEMKSGGGKGMKASLAGVPEDLMAYMKVCCVLTHAWCFVLQLVFNK